MIIDPSIQHAQAQQFIGSAATINPFAVQQGIQGHQNYVGASQPMSTPPTMVPVAREKTVTVYRKPSDRMKRELQDELKAVVDQGYKVTAIRHRGDQCDVHFVKHDSWTLDELMSEIVNGGEKCR